MLLSNDLNKVDSNRFKSQKSNCIVFVDKRKLDCMIHYIEAPSVPSFVFVMRLHFIVLTMLKIIRDFIGSIFNAYSFLLLFSFIVFALRSNLQGFYL